MKAFAISPRLARSSFVRERLFSTYAFIGLGKMGYPMAANMRRNLPASSTLLVYDTNPQSTANLGSGITIANDLKEIGRRAEVVITMLPNSEHVEACYFGDTGFCFDQPGVLKSTEEASAPKKLFIDCSTIDPFRSVEIGRYCEKHGLGTFVDAPVSGGVNGAKNKTLSFMIGHPKSDVSASSSGSLGRSIEDVLQTMGATFHFCGKRGAGLSAKLTNNYLLALTNLATAEAMRLGLKLGLDPQILGQVINSSTGKCWPSEKNNPVPGITPGAPVEKDYAGGFGIELMMKDLGLAMDAAQGAGVSLPSAESAMKMYHDAAQEFSGRDFGVVLKYLDYIQSEKIQHGKS